MTQPQEDTQTPGVGGFENHVDGMLHTLLQQQALMLDSLAKIAVQLLETDARAAYIESTLREHEPLLTRAAAIADPGRAMRTLTARRRRRADSETA